MTKLICVGACYLDTILSVPYFPEEDAKLRANSLSVRRGGNCPNSLEVLQQLLNIQPYHDVSLHLLSCLPSATAVGTAQIARSFDPNLRVDLSRCIYREEHQDPASSYIIRSESTGSRTLVNYNQLPEMTTCEFVEATSALTDDGDHRLWFHFEGRIPSTISQCILHIRQIHPDAKISVEVEKPGREGLEQLAALADVVFYSRAWAVSKGYQTGHDCLNAQSAVACRASLLICTWGSEGATFLSPTTRSCITCPALPPGQSINIVDTVGAGDTFIAGVLFVLLCHGESQGQEAVAFAVQLATCKVQQEGFSGVGAKVMSLRNIHLPL